MDTKKLAQGIAEVSAVGDDAALHAECGGKMHETGREAALRVIEHLRKSVAGQQKRAKKAEHQRDALAAANLAANKRIVELGHDRDAARAELAQPSICPNCTATLRRLDRMDSTGYAAYALDKARKDATGQNKRAQRVEQEAKALRAELARLTTPRPIAEAPRDGTWVQIHWNKKQYPQLKGVRWAIARYVPDCFVWVGERQEPLLEPTEYLPLPEVLS